MGRFALTFDKRIIIKFLTEKEIKYITKEMRILKGFFWLNEKLNSTCKLKWPNVEFTFLFNIRVFL